LWKENINLKIEKKYGAPAKVDKSLFEGQRNRAIVHAMMNSGDSIRFSMKDRWRAGVSACVD
jgi:hypothetical protein